MENKNECPDCIKWMFEFVCPPFALMQRALLPPAGEMT